MERNAVGNWAAIGYNAPGTKKDSSLYESDNFTYTDAFSDSKDTWTATAKTKLNDCPATTGKWIKTAEYEAASGTKDGNVKFATDKDKSTGECLNLTPSFDTIGNKPEG